MGLPRYCINLDELKDYIEGRIKSLTPNKYTYEIGWQRSKGFEVQTETNGVFYKKIEIPFEEYVITGLRVGMTSMNNIFDKTNARPKDYFHLMVNGEKIFESVYMKDITMYKNFRVPFKVTQEMIDNGLDIQFCYYNEGVEQCDFEEDENCESNVPVNIWFDIDFLAEPKLTEVIINYIDVNGNEIIPSKTRYISEGVIRIFSEDIEDYYIVGNYYEDINVIYDTPIVVNFEYIHLQDIESQQDESE